MSLFSFSCILNMLKYVSKIQAPVSMVRGYLSQAKMTIWTFALFRDHYLSKLQSQRYKICRTHISDIIYYVYSKKCDLF